MYSYPGNNVILADKVEELWSPCGLKYLVRKPLLNIEKQKASGCENIFVSPLDDNHSVKQPPKLQL